ncbi:MAG TPA: Rrf2 family transcriptional regulator [Clostridia bacterium]|nr:Rrf2 family transcriptional regulator [Clostridia bacterium]
MKISTKGRYGLRAMLDLAVFSNGNQVSLFNIAERQNISVNYLEQVFSSLRKAGLVRSVKGSQGGYILVSPPEEIKVGDILRCLEGNLKVVDEEPDNSGTQSGIMLTCIKQAVWDKINQSIDRVVDSVTLANLTEEYRNTDNQPMFYI